MGLGSLGTPTACVASHQPAAALGSRSTTWHAATAAALLLVNVMLHRP